MTEGWRADDSALDSDIDNVHFAVHMMSAIGHGDIPLIKYLLEQGISVDSTLEKSPVGGSPEGKMIEIMGTCINMGGM